MEPDAHYERLSFLDSTYLAMEGPNNPMHVGAVLVFEVGPLGRGTGIDIDTIRRFIEVRLQYVPRYRQRLAWIPLERHPVWVDDQHFDIEYHVRHAALPRPGTWGQLEDMTARIWAQRLDRGKPLWEVWVVEGLEGGRFALVSKVHHCMIDGIAGVDLLKVVLAPSPDDVIGELDDHEPRPVPSGTELFFDELERRLRGPIEAGRGLRRFVAGTRDLSEELRYRLSAITAAVRSGWFQNASVTPFNHDVGPNRSTAWWEVDLDRLKQIKDALGGTVNDVVLAIVAGGLRRYLREDRGVAVEHLDLRAMVPVSTRAPGEQGLGNRVTMWLVDLPVAEPSAVKRYRSVTSSTGHLKETNQALGAELLTRGVSWTPGTLLAIAARVAASTARPFNLTVTNVPGPQIPLYMLGARMVANYPMVPLWVNHGLGVALFSYDGRVAWSMYADRDQIPDVGRVRRRFERSLADLERAAETAQRRAPSQ